MTDARVREAERRWRRSGSTEDAAAWLRERVKAGGLEQSHVRWAASCGLEAAIAALDPVAAPPGLEVVATEVMDGRAEVEARLWVAVVRAGWGCLGDDRHLAYLWTWEGALVGLSRPGFSIQDYGSRASDLLLAVVDLAQRSVARFLGRGASVPLPLHLHCTPAEAITRLAQDVPLETIRGALVAEWAPWLVGLADPFTRRVVTETDPPRVRSIGWPDQAEGLSRLLAGGEVEDPGPASSPG